MATLKEKLESHLLIVLTGVVITTGGLVAGVIQYFNQQQLDSLRQSHEIEIGKSNSEYEANIQVLQNRLMSIKRRVGDETDFQDVTTFSITESMVRDLDTSYTAFANNAVFIDIPNNSEWEHETTNKFQLISEIMGGAINQEAIRGSGLDSIMSLPIELWTNENNIGIELVTESLFGEQILELSLNPYIYIQVYDSETIRQIASGISTFISEEFGSFDDEILLIEDLLDPAEGTSDSFTEYEEKEELLRNFESIFNDDLASVIMMGEFFDSYLLSIAFTGVSFSIDSVQKQGNVLYMQARTKFREDESVRIEGESENAIWDRETFFLGGKDYSVFVQASIPSYDGRSEEYYFIKEWLSKFHVVIN